MAKAKPREATERGDEEQREALGTLRPPAFDRNDPELRERLRRDSLAIANSPHEREIMDWMEEITADMDWYR